MYGRQRSCQWIQKSDQKILVTVKCFQLLTSTKEYNKQTNVLEVSVLYAPANVFFLVFNFIQMKKAPVISKKG